VTLTKTTTGGPERARLVIQCPSLALATIHYRWRFFKKDNLSSVGPNFIDTRLVPDE
jgi:hypothetical protein